MWSCRADSNRNLPLTGRLFCRLNNSSMVKKRVSSPKTPGPLISRNFARSWAAVFPRNSPGIEAPLGAHTSPRRSGGAKGGGVCLLRGGFRAVCRGGRRGGGLRAAKRAASGRKRAGNGGLRGKTVALDGETFGRKRGFGRQTAHSGRQNQRLRAENGGSFGRKVWFSAAWRGKTAGFLGERTGLRGRKGGKTAAKALLRGGLGAKTAAVALFCGRRVTGYVRT